MVGAFGIVVRLVVTIVVASGFIMLMGEWNEVRPFYRLIHSFYNYILRN